MTILPNVISALGTVTKELVQGLEDLEITGPVETVQTTAWLISARIPQRVPVPCCHANSSEELTANAEVKNSQAVK